MKVDNLPAFGTLDAAQKKFIEDLKTKYLVDEKIGAEMTVHPAVNLLDQNTRLLLIRGTFDVALPKMFAVAGSKKGGYFILVIDGEANPIRHNDNNRVLSHDDGSKIESKIRRIIEPALNEFLQGRSYPKKANLKKEILRKVCKEVTRLILSRRITAANLALFRLEWEDS